jgi:hypothetical protein
MIGQFIESHPGRIHSFLPCIFYLLELILKGFIGLRPGVASLRKGTSFAGLIGPRESCNMFSISLLNEAGPESWQMGAPLTKIVPESRFSPAINSKSKPSIGGRFCSILRRISKNVNTSPGFVTTLVILTRGDHKTSKQGVAGSSPAGRSFFSYTYIAIQTKLESARPHKSRNH